MRDGVLQRLLGPDRQPLSCEQCFEELDRYVEWKLAEGDRPFHRCVFCSTPVKCTRALECLAMNAHLESCKACDEEFASLRDLVLAERGDGSL